MANESVIDEQEPRKSLSVHSQENTENSFVEGHQSNTNSSIDISDENSSTTSEQSFAGFEPIDGMEFEWVSSLF